MVSGEPVSAAAQKPSAHQTLTERQQREYDYHRDHAKQYQHLLEQPFNFDAINQQHGQRRWWNAYWAMFDFLAQQPLAGRRALVIGCGFGDDALRLAKLGAEVDAFDLSPESLQIASALADKENLSVRFKEMPAETLDYPDNTFDLLLARDILHHVDIPAAMSEAVRVGKPGAQFVINEIYSHSMTNKIRHSRLVEHRLYPLMQRFIYQGKPYITEDERKLTEVDMRAIMAALGPLQMKRYFNVVVTRLIPDKYDTASKIDRALLKFSGPAGALLAGRILAVGPVQK